MICIYYLVDDDPLQMYGEEDIDQMIEECTSKEYYRQNYQEEFNNMLDEEGRVEICGCKYWRSDILRAIAPAKYEEEYDSYLDQLVDSTYEWVMDSVSCTRPGGSFYICEHQIFCYEDESVELHPITDDIEQLRKLVKKEEPDIAFESLFMFDTSNTP